MKFHAKVQSVYAISTKLGHTLLAGSATLYHWTDIRKLLAILTEDQFRLSSSSGTKAEKQHGPKEKSFYLSCSRSKTGGYQWNKGYGATLVLDGTALGHTMEVKPIDYWGHGWKKAARDSKNSESLQDNTEMEDRVFSTKPFIKDAAKYIKEIHMAVPPKMNHLEHDKSKARKVAILAKQLGIPVFIYDDKKNFQTLNKSKAVDVKHLATPGYSEKHWVDFGGSNRLHRYISLYKAPNYESLPDEAKKMMSNLRYRDETVTDIEQWIHNSRMNSTKKEKDQAAELTMIMNKNKWSVKEFADFLREKWKA